MKYASLKILLISEFILTTIIQSCVASFTEFRGCSAQSVRARFLVAFLRCILVFRYFSLDLHQPSATDVADDEVRLPAQAQRPPARFFEEATHTD